MRPKRRVYSLLFVALSALAFQGGSLFALQDKAVLPLALAVEILQAEDSSSRSAWLGKTKLSILVRSLAASVQSQRAGELSDGHIGNLRAVYELTRKEQSYEALIIADMAKRILLDWVRVRLSALAQAPEPADDELKTLRDLVDALALDSGRLVVLLNDQERKMNQTAEAGAALVDRVETICKSHDYDSTNQWLVERLREVPPTLESVLWKVDSPNALFRVLETEMIRTVFIDGTIEFLLRGGQVDMVSVHDVRPFRSVMPYEDSARFGFPIFGIKSFGASHVLLVIGPETEQTQAGDGAWIRTTFEMYRGTEPTVSEMDDAR